MNNLTEWSGRRTSCRTSLMYIVYMLGPNKVPCEILVTSNCQTTGIANSLMYLAGDDKIPIGSEWNLGHTVESYADKNSSLFESLSFWVTSYSDLEIKKVLELVNANPKMEVIRIPQIYFDAYHPDLTYIIGKSGIVESPLVHYHSKIIFGSFLNRVNIRSVKGYFQKDAYRELGYLNYWDKSIKRMKKDFLQSDLDYYDFINNIDMNRVFMHSVNHPATGVLSAIAALVCKKIGLKQKYDPKALTNILKDEIFEYGPVWPVYPDIANHFGQSGTFLFRAQGGKIYELDEFIQLEYETFNNLEKSELDEPNFYFSNEFLSTLRGLK
jgi:hypothetical protein